MKRSSCLWCLSVLLGCGAQTSPPDSDGGGHDSDLTLGRYEIVLPTDTISADGHSKVPYFAVGILPDGGPATGAVVLSVSPSYAATVTPATFTLGRAGTTGVYLACNATGSTACVGQVELTLALASNPSAPLARTIVNQVQPTAVGTATPCQTGGDVLFLDANDGGSPDSSAQLITDGAWSAAGSASEVHLWLTPSNSNQGDWWSVDLVALSDQPALDPGVYDAAERYLFQSPGHPGMSISSDRLSCSPSSGRFQIQEYVFDGGFPVSLTATFEERCDGQPPVLRGCVHWSR